MYPCESFLSGAHHAYAH